MPDGKHYRDLNNRDRDRICAEYPGLSRGTVTRLLYHLDHRPTAADLLAMGRDELTKLPNMGPATVAEVLSWARSHEVSRSETASGAVGHPEAGDTPEDDGLGSRGPSF